MSSWSWTSSHWSGNTSPTITLNVTTTANGVAADTVSWSLVINRPSKVSSSASKSWSVTVAGQTWSGNTTIGGSGSKTIASGSKTVNKTKSQQAFNCSASLNIAISWSGSYKGTISTSGTIYCNAKPSYTVSYNANGGSGAPGSQTKWYGENITLSSTRPSRTGYTFAGWATSSDGSVAYSPGSTYSSNSSVTLYAKWNIITYTVSYNANGGSGAPGSQTKKYGTNLTLSSTKPTRTNYNFKGWATSSGGAVAYAAGGTYSSNSSVTLYAVWELAYVRPRINNIEVKRCNSSGTAADDGTYASVTFSWDTDKSVSSIQIRYYQNPAGSSSTVNVSASGTGGVVSNKIIGDGGISIDYSYTVVIEVTDAGGSTSRSATISGFAYAIDFMKGGVGVAFGKPADAYDRVDCNMPVIFRQGIEGQITKNTAGQTWLGSRNQAIIRSEGKPDASFNPSTSTQSDNGYHVTGVRYDRYTIGYISDSDYNVGMNRCIVLEYDGPSGRLYANNQNDIGFMTKHIYTGKILGCGVGSGGYNRGIHDGSYGNWIVYRNSSDDTIINTKSDARVKDIIGEMPDDEMLTLLTNIIPTNYTLKSDENKIIHNGFIAQNVRDILIENDIGYRPYLQIDDKDGKDEDIFDLNTPEEDVKYGLDYSKFVPLLLKGWQYHEKVIKELQDEIKELKKGGI